MTHILFESIDTVNRTVTLKVGATLVTRGYASNVTDIDAYIKALAEGLKIEFPESETVLSPTSFVKGEEVTANSAPVIV